MTQILYTYACKWKNGIFETIPGVREGKRKESGGGGEFKYDMFDIL
jgi:hypothetical protein